MVQTQRRQVKEYLAESEEDLRDPPQKPAPLDQPAPSTSGGNTFLAPPSAGHLQSRSAPNVVHGQAVAGPATGPLSGACGNANAEGGGGVQVTGPASAPAVPSRGTLEEGTGDAKSGNGDMAAAAPSPQPSTSSGVVAGGARRKSRKRSDQVGQEIGFTHPMML